MDHRTPAVRRQVFADYYCPIESGYKDRSGVLPYDNAVCRALASSYRKPKDVKGSEERTLFVARLSSETEEADLEKVFGRYGELQEVRLTRDLVTGAPRGYAFVVFSRRRDAAAARAACRRLCIAGADVVVEPEFSRGLRHWRPRRLGGGLGGRKESGQLRFGGSARPFLVSSSGPVGSGPMVWPPHRGDPTLAGAEWGGPGPAGRWNWTPADQPAPGTSHRHGSSAAGTHRDRAAAPQSSSESGRWGGTHGHRRGDGDRGASRGDAPCGRREPPDGLSRELPRPSEDDTEEGQTGSRSRGDRHRHKHSSRDRQHGEPPDGLSGELPRPSEGDTEEGQAGSRSRGDSHSHRHRHRHSSRDRQHGEPASRRRSHKHRDRHGDKHKHRHKDSDSGKLRDSGSDSGELRDSGSDSGKFRDSDSGKFRDSDGGKFRDSSRHKKRDGSKHRNSGTHRHGKHRDRRVATEEDDDGDGRRSRKHRDSRNATT